MFPNDDKDAPIEGRLDIVPLSAAPKYDALSYVWGGEEKPCTILVNGRGLPVTVDLLEALRHLRFRESSVDELVTSTDTLVEQKLENEHKETFGSALAQKFIVDYEEDAKTRSREELQKLKEDWRHVGDKEEIPFMLWK